MAKAHERPMKLKRHLPPRGDLHPHVYIDAKAPRAGHGMHCSTPPPHAAHLLQLLHAPWNSPLRSRIMSAPLVPQFNSVAGVSRDISLSPHPSCRRQRLSTDDSSVRAVRSPTPSVLSTPPRANATDGFRHRPNGTCCVCGRTHACMLLLPSRGARQGRTKQATATHYAP